MRVPLLALLLLLPLVAGCLGTEEPADLAARSADAADADATADAPPAPADGTAAPAPAEPVATPFSFDGVVEQYLCAPGGPGWCASPVPMGSGAQRTALGDYASASLTLSWEAAGPVTEELTLTVSAARPCAEGCWEYRRIADATGTSPIALDVADLALEEGETLSVGVHAPGACHSVAVLFGCANPSDQPFRVEGTLLGPAS